MKKLLFTLSLIITAFITNAQDKKFQIGLGPVISFPSGLFSTTNSVGFGGEFNVNYNIDEKFQVFTQVGVHSFSGKKLDLGFDLDDYTDILDLTESDLKTPSYTHVPVILGARYKIANFVAGLGVGYGSYATKGTSFSGFTFSPQVGLNLEKIDIIAHYTSTSIFNVNYNYFGVKTAYKF